MKNETQEKKHTKKTKNQNNQNFCKFVTNVSRFDKNKMFLFLVQSIKIKKKRKND